MKEIGTNSASIRKHFLEIFLLSFCFPFIHFSLQSGFEWRFFLELFLIYLFVSFLRIICSATYIKRWLYVKFGKKYIGTIVQVTVNNLYYSKFLERWKQSIILKVQYRNDLGIPYTITTEPIKGTGFIEDITQYRAYIWKLRKNKKSVYSQIFQNVPL